MALARSIANRYARALVDVALEQKVQERVPVELEEVQGLLARQAELRQVLENPALPAPVRVGILTQVLERAGIHKVTQNFLLFLLTRNRLAFLGDIVQAFMDALDARMGILAAEVITAADLAPGQREQLRARLSEMIGRKVKPNFGTDPSIIGGVVVKIGSTIYDGSIRQQLETVRQRIAG